MKCGCPLVKSIGYPWLGVVKHRVFFVEELSLGYSTAECGWMFPLNLLGKSAGKPKKSGFDLCKNSGFRWSFFSRQLHWKFDKKLWLCTKNGAVCLLSSWTSIFLQGCLGYHAWRIIRHLVWLVSTGGYERVTNTLMLYIVCIVVDEWNDPRSHSETNRYESKPTVDGCKSLHHLIGGKHPIILNGFQPSKWCRISSSIHSIKIYFWCYPWNIHKMISQPSTESYHNHLFLVLSRTKISIKHINPSRRSTNPWSTGEDWWSHFRRRDLLLGKKDKGSAKRSRLAFSGLVPG